MSRFIALVCFAAAACFLSAQRAPLFKDEILPVLQKNCTSCHSPERKMGGLDLTTFTGMMNGGSSGPVIAPGKPQRSLMWLQIDSGKMPMGGRIIIARRYNFQIIKVFIDWWRLGWYSTCNG